MKALEACQQELAQEQKTQQQEKQEHLGEQRDHEEKIKQANDSIHEAQQEVLAAKVPGARIPGRVGPCWG